MLDGFVMLVKARNDGGFEVEARSFSGAAPGFDFGMRRQARDKAAYLFQLVTAV